MNAKKMTGAALFLALGAPALAGAEPTAAKRTLTIEGAKKAITAAVGAARKAGATGVVAVVDDGGNLMALERVDGTFAAGANISIGKARTAALFKKPTKFFEDVIGKGRYAMTAVDFTPLQGGVPIVVDSQVVGGIGVSGASSAQQDEEFALAGAGALAGAEGATRTITFLPAADVSAAFAKGQPLLEVENYKIHASRREGPGQAEVHTQDTDIVYVLSGTATFVTGGRVVGGRETAPEEIRGSSVEGGESRTLRPGDVAVVPNGTPHWFKEVKGPMTYYVVKVRAEGGR
jgi:glc operon protein GlcG